MTDNIKCSTTVFLTDEVYIEFWGLNGCPLYIHSFSPETLLHEHSITNKEWSHKLMLWEITISATHVYDTCLPSNLRLRTLMNMCGHCQLPISGNLLDCICFLFTGAVAYRKFDCLCVLKSIFLLPINFVPQIWSEKMFQGIFRVDLPDCQSFKHLIMHLAPCLSRY